MAVNASVSVVLKRARGRGIIIPLRARGRLFCRLLKIIGNTRRASHADK